MYDEKVQGPQARGPSEEGGNDGRGHAKEQKAGPNRLEALASLVLN